MLGLLVAVGWLLVWVGLGRWFGCCVFGFLAVWFWFVLSFGFVCIDCGCLCLILVFN